MNALLNRCRLLPLWTLIIVVFVPGCGGGDSSSDNNPAPVTPGLQSTSLDAGSNKPVLLDEPPESAAAGGYYTYTPNVLYAKPDRATYSIRNKPSWAFFEPDTGQLYGSPRLDDMGAWAAIIITVNTPDGDLKIGPFEIFIEAPASDSLEVVGIDPDTTGNMVELASYSGRASSTNTWQGSQLKRVQHPGHYMSMNRWDNTQKLLSVMRPGVTGIQKRYYWKMIEKSRDNYDFSKINADLELMENQGRKLIVFIEDKTFNGDIPTPDYLNWATVPNRNKGYTTLRWRKGVAARFKKLINEVGRRFDGHPAFEGIAIQESSLSLDNSVLAQYGYTPELYRDTLIDVLKSASGSMPTSTVFWYMNFIPQRQQYIAEIANAIIPAGVAMGGPDVLPDEESLTRITYPLYDQFQGKLTLFNSIQNDSYKHPHKTGGYRTKYWTPNELFRFARDDLHVSYLFWNRKAWTNPPGSYTWWDALPVMRNNPEIRAAN